MVNYKRINWENGTNTPLSAENLNKMDAAIFGMFEVINGEVRVLIDPTVDNNVNPGEMNVESRPYSDISYVLQNLPEGSAVKIYIKGKVTVTARTASWNSHVQFLAYTDGSPAQNTASEDYSITIANGGSIMGNGASELQFRINTVVEGVRGLKLGSVGALSFEQHIANNFADTVYHAPNPTQVTIKLAGAIVIKGSGSSLSLKACNLIVGTVNGVVAIGDNSTTGLAAGKNDTKVNGAPITSSSFTNLFTGILKVEVGTTGGYYPANVLTSIPLDMNNSAITTI